MPTVITSNPAIKKVGKQTIAFASGAVGVQKIVLTGKQMKAGNVIAYPGFEELRRQSKPRPSGPSLTSLTLPKAERDGRK